MDYLKFQHEKLSVEAITEMVSSPSCGAISLFLGTTRDNFEDKQVISLEYEAYESMAMKSLENICKEIRSKWPEVENIVIYHRLGLVPVKEASIVIGISSPNRADALKATEYCIDNVKKSVPIWKKEVYADSKTQWKENKELNYVTLLKRKINIEQQVEVPYLPSYLIQIKASNLEVNQRIERYMIRKRTEIDVSNVAEFCCGDRNSEFSCARVDAVLQKRKDSKGHLQVNRVSNSCQYRDQKNSGYLLKFIPPNGIEERLQNVECQLNLTTPTPKSIYNRLKMIEERLLHLESISPEYIQFWDKVLAPTKPIKKKIFSLDEIDDLIADAAKKIKNS